MLEKAGGVAWITLNRPRVLNVYNVRMRDELYEALGLIEDDSDTLVAVLRGKRPPNGVNTAELVLRGR